MDQKRPQARKKNVSSGGNGAYRRGNGLGTGPVGSSNSGSSGKRAMVKGGIGLPTIVVIVYFILKIFGGGDDYSTDYEVDNSSGNSSGYSSSDSGGHSADDSVAAGSRGKRTSIIGNGADQVTLMVYICGTDLESGSGMASSDIKEMASAKFGDQVNLIIYTGGCKNWKINGISNSKNQIYQIKDGKFTCLESDMGDSAMTDPKTLSSFIKYCSKNFPANRNDLILWDHGGGSVSGYGYDENKKSSGSMDLSMISTALKDGGVAFDFVGFDACLMATAETAFMLDDYADYLIASEETEPGIGWYYSKWLTNLGSNTSLSTVEIGKNIIDDFVSTCSSQCRGQKTTLSIIDLAEFSNTVPEPMKRFAESISYKLEQEEYKTVSDARYNTREFAQSSKIDQIDLINFAQNMNTPAGNDLIQAISGAVKYNRTSSNMTNAYGISIYFPYKRTSSVDAACRTYEKIGMDSSYSKCIRQFASLEVSGQVASGGSSSPVSSILDGIFSDGSSQSSSVIGDILSSFLKGSSDRNISGLDSSNTQFMDDLPVSQENTAEYIALNHFDTSNLVWKNENGKNIMVLPEEQWNLVHRLDKNLFYDDGEGYIDLGLDNVYDFDSEGNLIADDDKTWISINNQPVAYYHTDTTDPENEEYSITGYVPVMLNGNRANLILVFDNNNPNGYVAGAVSDYKNGETETVAKSMTELVTGDKIDFICDFYSYDGVYMDSYYLGETIEVSGELKITNTVVGDGEAKITYCFTDIYDQTYWSEPIIK